jgi:uncharacterized protein
VLNVSSVAGQGVHVTALCPGFTRTEFLDDGQDGAVALPDFAWPRAPDVARAGLDAVAAGRAASVPGSGCKAVVALSRIVPRRPLRSIMKALRRV